MSAAIDRHDAVSRRVSAALCLIMLAAFGWGLQRITLGFDVWTFEGRREVQWRSGALRAAAVPLRGVSGSAPSLWHQSAVTPAAYLVDFVYTRCPSVCRVLGSEYQQMQRKLAARQADERAGAALGNVHLVSISFDVEHDDPAQLARYATSLGVDRALWTFAVPATPGDARTLLRSLGVVAIPDGQGGFVHNGEIHLLDERGRLRGLFEADQWPQALAAASRLAQPTRTAVP